jgi:hypothetical protein
MLAAKHSLEIASRVARHPSTCTGQVLGKELKYYSHSGACEWQDQSSSGWLGLNRRVLIKRLKTADKALKAAEKKDKREII